MKQVDLLNRDELTERRRKMVEKAFRILDRDNCGSITLADISKLICISTH